MKQISQNLSLLLLLVASVGVPVAWADDKENAYTERDREKCLEQLERRVQPDDQCDEILGLDDGYDDGSVYSEDELSDDIESRRAERLDERAERVEERGNEERADRLEERSDNVEERRDALKDSDLGDRDEGDEGAQPKAKSRAKGGSRGAGR